ncbi:MAG: SpoIID/LytB domain-containing protein [Myxococcota bacterium]
MRKIISFILVSLFYFIYAYGDELDFEISTHYFHAIRFNPKNIPVTSILISNQHTSYNVSSRGNFTIEYRDGGKIKSITSREVIIERLDYKKGEQEYKLIADKVNFNDKETLKKSEEGLNKIGFETESILVGSVFGLKGKVYDNRQYYISIATFKEKEEADNLITEIFEKYRIRTFLLPVLKRHPSGNIRIIVKDKNISVSTKNVVWVKSQKDKILLTDEQKRNNYGYYNGDFYFTFEVDGRFAAINRVDLEELLRGILPSEIYASAPTEALKAQAVAARTEILSAIGHRHPATPYLLCATQHCQVYSGVNSYTNQTDKAISDTFGQVLLFEKRFVKAVYSSNCGGFTEDNNTVWNEHKEPYLTPKPDAPQNSNLYKKFKDGITDENLEEFLYTVDDSYCSTSSFNNRKAFRWKVEIYYDEIMNLLKKRFDIRSLDDIIIEGRGQSGRIRGITIISGDKKYYVDTEYNIRQLFGGLKSGLMIIEKKKDSNQRLISLIFTGGGWGHGVGMCQTGAIGMAERGKNFDEILMHYYSGVRIEKVY